jgi:hypothetical protein
MKEHDYVEVIEDIVPDGIGAAVIPSGARGTIVHTWEHWPERVLIELRDPSRVEEVPVAKLKVVQEFNND